METADKQKTSPYAETAGDEGNRVVRVCFWLEQSNKASGGKRKAFAPHKAAGSRKKISRLSPREI